MENLCWSVNSLPSFNHLKAQTFTLSLKTQISKRKKKCGFVLYCGCIISVLPYLIRGKGVVSVEQENWISSPSIRQALSSRLTNLGGAGEMKKSM